MTTRQNTSRTTESIQRRGLSLLAILVAVVVIACLYVGKLIFIPLALAIIVSFLLQPLVRALEHVRVNRIVAVILVVFLVGVVAAGLGSKVLGQLGILAKDLRTNEVYVANIKSKISDLRMFSAGGFTEDLQVVFDDLSGELESEPGTQPGIQPDTQPGTEPDTEPAPDSEPSTEPAGELSGETGDEAGPTEVVLREEPASQLDVLRATAAAVAEPLGTAALVIALVIFMLIGREDLRNRIISLFGADKLMLTTRAINDAGRRIGRYLLMQLIINATYGLILGGALSLLEVPFAWLWGFMAFLLRYIPYVGPLLGASLPIATSLMAFPGWFEAVTVLIAILALELFSNMVMEPVLYGQSVGISAIALILAAAFWTAIWGPIGLVLSTPLTVCLVVLGQHVPQLRLFAVLLGDEPALPVPMRYYQRLLAGDKLEAAALVNQALANSSDPADAFDAVMMPALAAARRDREAGALTAEDQSQLLTLTEEILETLEAAVAAPPPAATLAQPTATLAQPVGATPQPAGATLESAEATLKSAEAQRLAATAGSREATAEPPADAAPPNKPFVLGCPARHESEELALRMLCYAMRLSSYDLRPVSTRLMYTQILARIAKERPVAVFIAVVRPGGLSQAAFLCRRIHRRYPNIPVVVGVWGRTRDYDNVLVRMRSIGANIVTTSLRQSKRQLLTYQRSQAADAPTAQSVTGE